MASIGFIIADYVCPTIGCIMSTLTFMAPIKSLQSAIKSGNLGSLNPTPWIFMTGEMSMHDYNVVMNCYTYVLHMLCIMYIICLYMHM